MHVTFSSFLYGNHRVIETAVDFLQPTEVMISQTVIASRNGIVFVLVQPPHNSPIASMTTMIVNLRIKSSNCHRKIPKSFPTNIEGTNHTKCIIISQTLLHKPQEIFRTSETESRQLTLHWTSLKSLLVPWDRHRCWIFSKFNINCEHKREGEPFN